jgi:large subunit ribosomal protein L22
MKNEFKATQKYLIESPRKLRAVVALIKKMKPTEAIERLPFAGKRAADNLSKVIKSALANAKNQGVGETDLVFKEIQIGEGPRLKRGKAASRGRWHPFKRRMSHIRVVLTLNKQSVPSDGKQISSKQITKSEKMAPEEGGKDGKENESVAKS